MQVQDAPGVLSGIARVFGENGVSIASVVQEQGVLKEKGDARLILVTHKVKEGQFLAAMDTLEQSDAIHQIDNIIRVEE